MLQQSLSGCSHCCENLELFKPNLQCYGVKTLVQHICRRTQSFTPERSILKWTFTLFVSGLLRSNYRFVSSHPRIKLPISSLSHSLYRCMIIVNAISIFCQLRLREGIKIYIHIHLGFVQTVILYNEKIPTRRGTSGRQSNRTSFRGGR